MSYVDAIHDRTRERIHVVERVDGKRVYREYNCNYVFYFEDENGNHRSIFDTPVRRVSCRSNKDMRRELGAIKGKRVFESDINPIFRCLAENYLGSDSPSLQTAFFDIETEIGRASCRERV